uniref:Uncharacterized protein n=1 Tax=Moorena producens (strain JHB) TaxID=1454205 RepID=A0A1D9G088_MOOP1
MTLGIVETLRDRQRSRCAPEVFASAWPKASASAKGDEVFASAWPSASASAPKAIAKWMITLVQYRV